MTAPLPTIEHTLQIQGMSCAACQAHVQRALEAVPGVQSATVNLMAHSARVFAAPDASESALIEAVRESGYRALTAPAADENKGAPAESSRLGLRAILSLAAGAFAMAVSMLPLMSAGAWSYPLRWLLCALALAVMVFAAPEIYTAACRAALHRSTNMNTLVAIGTVAAFAESLAATIAPETLARHGMSGYVYYEAVILILAFLLSGRWLEARARAAATRALESFAELEPADARLLSNPSDMNSADTLLPLSAIEVGDVIRILPGDRVPLDGVILSGRSSIDESMLTGEPLPVTRSAGDKVSGGTLNLDGVLVLQAAAIGAASTLAKMRRLLEQAQASRAPMQRLADQVSAIFVPSVLVLAATTFGVWWIYGTPAQALSVSIAVLIIACPCAMGLAVPAAITVSIGAAAKQGLLIKGGEALERLATVDTLALDKTGTLTEGCPRIAHFELLPGASVNALTLLSYAAAAERLSTHPLARAVVGFSGQQAVPGTPPVVIENFSVIAGTGITFTSNGEFFAIGNSLFASGEIPARMAIPASLPHATPLYVLRNGVLQAVFFAVDTLRGSAAGAIAELKKLNITALLLTGDVAASAQVIAREAGIEDVRAHLLPADKLTIIRSLQQQGHRVAMAGDGINDAAAMAQADAGLAMAAGTDLAREAGDVLLLQSDLHLIPQAIRLARRTVRIMRQNLAWAMLYNVVGIPLAAGAFYPHFHVLLSPVVASAAMALSSVSVLLNSLRLRYSA